MRRVLIFQLALLVGCSQTTTPDTTIPASAIPASRLSELAAGEDSSDESSSSEGSPTTEMVVVNGFYSVDTYDGSRDPTADLAGTVKLAASKKRILLEVGGDW